MKPLVIAAVGPDRPGLVDELTAPLAEKGANIADSRMVNLRGQFALVLLVDVPDSVADELAQLALQTAEGLGLQVTVSRGDELAHVAVKGVPYRLRVSAMDQPGIVHRVTHLLHQLGVNIENLQTSLDIGSYSGTPLFALSLTMTVPPDVRVRQLRDQLDALCDQLNCDFDLEPAPRDPTS